MKELLIEQLVKRPEPERENGSLEEKDGLIFIPSKTI